MKRWFTSVSIMIVILLVACTPKAAPAPSAPSATALARAPAPVSNVSPPTSQDTAWANVVETAKKEGTVVIYSSALVADIGQRVSRDFRAQYGIRVEILAGAGRSSVEKIKVEQTLKRPIADIQHSAGAASVSELVDAGLMEPIAHQLPVLRDKTVFKVDPVYSPGGESIIWIPSYLSVLINTNLVKPQDEPKSYIDLLAPRWKGQILSPDPRSAGNAPLYYVPRYFKALDMDYYRNLAPQIKIWPGNIREGGRIVARGEYPMIFSGATEWGASLMAEGAPLKYPPLVDEWVIGIMGTIAVIKNAPHPNAARLFVNWLLSPEGQLAYCESGSSTPLRKDVPDFIAPGARLNPKKILVRTWDYEVWAVKDDAGKTMEQIFGAK